MTIDFAPGILLGLGIVIVMLIVEVIKENHE